jgi:hypothetical protein
MRAVVMGRPAGPFGNIVVSDPTISPTHVRATGEMARRLEIQAGGPERKYAPWPCRSQGASDQTGGIRSGITRDLARSGEICWASMVLSPGPILGGRAGSCK